METSSTRIRRGGASATPLLSPPYRPHAKTKCASSLQRWATDCLNGTPAGVGTTRSVSVEHISSSASPHPGAVITIPGPPPYGASSTDRCTSWVHCRRSCTRRSTVPVSIALPGNDCRNGSRYWGKIVMISICTLCTSVDLQQTIGRIDLNELVRQRHRRDDCANERNKCFARVTRAADGQQLAGRRVQHLGHRAHITPFSGADR